MKQLVIENSGNTTNVVRMVKNYVEKIHNDAVVRTFKIVIDLF